MWNTLGKSILLRDRQNNIKLKIENKMPNTWYTVKPEVFITYVTFEFTL